MGYGYGVGFVKATSDIPIKTIRLPTVTNPAAGQYNNCVLLGTTTNYQVPTGKTAIIALERAVLTTTTDLYKLGYADDASGTNFVPLIGMNESDLGQAGNERYWIFQIPSDKFIGFKNTHTSALGVSFAFILVLFEV
jgi:hypothetical protein